VASVLLAPVMAAASLLSRPSRRRHSGEERVGEGRGYPLAYVLEKLLLAQDRRRMLTRMMRAVTSGSIVISQGSLAGLGGSAFDDRAVEQARSRLHRWLMTRERNLSRDLPTPRLVLAVGAEAGTASQGSSTAVIDASGTVEDALRHCMRETWEAL
jgi:hypothetical protein